MVVLIGSRALAHFGRLKNRKPADWDVLWPRPERKFFIGDERIEAISTGNSEEKTNRLIYEYCLKHGNEYVSSPVGKILVAPLCVLKALKLASLSVEKEKHSWDLLQMGDIELDPELKKVLKQRITETKRRVARQKARFFNRYDIPRFFEHDELHLYVSQKPAYKNILKARSAVEPDQVKFEALSLTKKRLVIWEECFVLALERNLIPQVRRAPMFVEQIAENFSSVSMSDDPSLKWLGRLSLPGKVKDHPEWLAQWAHEHSDELFAGFEAWWNKKLEGLPVSFWQKLLTFSR